MHLSSVSPVVNMVNRLIWLCVINGMSLWKIIAADGLLRSSSKNFSYAEIRKRSNKRGTDRDFLREILSDRVGTGVADGQLIPNSEGTAELQSNAGVSTLSMTERWRGPSTPGLSRLDPPYRNRIEFYNKGEGLRRRLDRSLGHARYTPGELKGSRRSGKNCSLCASLPRREQVEMSPAGVGRAIARMEPGNVLKIVKPPDTVQCKTKVCCTDCGGVFLCNVRRYITGPDGRPVLNDKTCFEIWHDRRSRRLVRMKYVQRENASARKRRRLTSSESVEGGRTTVDS